MARTNLDLVLVLNRAIYLRNLDDNDRYQASFRIETQLCDAIIRCGKATDDNELT